MLLSCNGLSYLVFLILGFTVVKPFNASQVHNADPEILKFGIEYLSTVMIFSFGLLGQFFFERLLTSTGKTIFSMTSQLCGAITNIILDPILIFGLFGAPKMGVTGAAVATVIGQCVACIVAGICNHKFNHEVRLSFRGFRPDLKIIGHIYAVGIPSIIMQSISSIMTYCMNLILVQFTVTATAIFGVYFKLQSFFFMPVFGLNNGITPIIAYNYGARHRKRMLKTVKVSMFIAFCFTFIGFLAFEFIPKTLLGLFSASEDMLTIGIPALRIIGIHYLIAWFCIIAGTCIPQGIALLRKSFGRIDHVPRVHDHRLTPVEQQECAYVVVVVVFSIVAAFASNIERSPLPRKYLELGDLDVRFLGRGFAWLDTGTVDALMDAAHFIRTVEKLQGIKICSPEEIAYNKRWITKKALISSAEKYGKSTYGQHLRRVAEGKILYENAPGKRARRWGSDDDDPMIHALD